MLINHPKNFLFFLTILVLLGCRALATGELTLEETASPVPPTKEAAGSVPPGYTRTPQNVLTATLIPSTTDESSTSLAHPKNISAGDAYAPELGNGGYDIQQYTIRLVIEPASAKIDAHVTITATAIMEGLEQVTLDFIGYEIQQVSVDGALGDYFRLADKLAVDLPPGLSGGQTFTIDVHYSGEPSTRSSPYVPFISHVGPFFNEDGTFFVTSEPDGARFWIPCNDHPRDKALFRFELLVPGGLTGVANGQLVETQFGIGGAFTGEVPGDRFIWVHDYPMATAFATVAVGNYVRVEGWSPSGIPLRSYVFTGQEAAMQANHETVGEAIEWMGELLGQYPFEAFGYVVVPGFNASLETQTMVVLSEESMNSEQVLIHELAHMWFGDWVSLDSWGEMWRSEGFATYFSLLWETRQDPADIEPIFSDWNEGIQGNPSGYRLNNPPSAQLFGRDSYLKGALLVGALRREMGNQAFFDGLRGYFELYGGKSATHEELQEVMEAASSLDLNAFFSEWFSP